MFTLTNAIIVFILYLYLYLLKSLYLVELIVVYNFIEVECIYSTCISTVFIEHIYIFISLYIYSDLLGWILFSFIQYMCYKIY